LKTIPEQYLEDIKTIISLARAHLGLGRELDVVVFLGKAGKMLKAFPLSAPEKTAQNILISLVRAFARTTKAEYAILISEGWGLNSTLNREEVTKFAESGESILNHPDRKNVVMIMLETQTGFWMSQTQIKSLDGEARDFDDPKFEFTHWAEGRFTNFLPHENTH